MGERLPTSLSLLGLCHNIHRICVLLILPYVQYLSQLQRAPFSITHRTNLATKNTIFMLEFVFAIGAHLVHPAILQMCPRAGSSILVLTSYLHLHSLTTAPATFAGKDVQKERDGLQNEKGFINNESFIFPLRQRQISAAAERSINANREGLKWAIMCNFEPLNMTL